MVLTEPQTCGARASGHWFSAPFWTVLQKRVGCRLSTVGSSFFLVGIITLRRHYVSSVLTVPLMFNAAFSQVYQRLYKVVILYQVRGGTASCITGINSKAKASFCVSMSKLACTWVNSSRAIFQMEQNYQVTLKKMQDHQARLQSISIDLFRF